MEVGGEAKKTHRVFLSTHTGAVDESARACVCAAAVTDSRAVGLRKRAASIFVVEGEKRARLLLELLLLLLLVRGWRPGPWEPWRAKVARVRAWGRESVRVAPWWSERAAAAAALRGGDGDDDFFRRRFWLHQASSKVNQPSHR